MALAPVIKIASTIYKHRKWIYRTLVAQDKLLDKSLRYGRISKAGRYGIRHGLISGTIIGSLISQGEDELDDGIWQTPIREPTQTGKFDKTRGRRTGRYSRRYKNPCYPRTRYRKPYARWRG